MSFPQFTGVAIQGANIGYSNQHTVTLTAQKRFSAGVQLLATYTPLRTSRCGRSSLEMP